MEKIKLLIKNSLMEAAMQPSCTDFETKTDLILNQIETIRKENLSSKLLAWMFNPSSKWIGDMQDELFDLRRRNELLEMNIRAYQMMGLNVKSMADLELAQIKKTKLYRFMSWWQNLPDIINQH